MRVMILPLIGISNINGDSDYLFYADIVKGAADRGWYFYMVLPDYAEGQVAELPNCEYIYVPMGKDFFEESMHFPYELVKYFGRRDGKYLIDLILTTRTGGSVMGQSMLSDFRRTFHVPTVLMEAMVRAWKKPNDVDASLRAMSYCLAHTWLLSTEEKLRAMDIIKRVCSPYLANQFLQNSRVIETGVRIHDLDKVIEEAELNEKFSLFFGARFSVEKRPDIMQEMVEKLYSYGRDINVYVTTQHVGSRYLQKYGKSVVYTELKVGCPRDEFLKLASSCHVFICSSEDESWPSGFWEQLYVVGIGIFPDKPWVRANLPKDYPYIYKDMMEGHTMLRYILENYEEAKEKVAWIRPWIRENANWRTQLDKALDWFEEIEKPTQKLSEAEEGQGKKGREGLGNLIMKSVESFGDKPIEWQELLTKIDADSDTYKSKIIARTLYPNRYEVYRFILEHGYKDLCNGPEPVLVKVGSNDK